MEKGIDEQRLEEIVESLKDLGGIAKLSDIFVKIEQRNNIDMKTNKNWHSSIRKIIQENAVRAEEEITKHYKNIHTDPIFYSYYGIKERRGVWGLIEYQKNDKPPQKRYDDKDILDLDQIEYTEGREKYIRHLKKERNYQLVSDAKKQFINEHGSLYCEICGFDFKETYGIEFIEAHHIIPISEAAEDHKTKIEDLAMLCSNCHRVIHRTDKPDALEYLKKCFMEKKK